MIKKILSINLLLWIVVNTAPSGSNSASASELCEAEGYTLIICTQTRSNYDDTDEDDVVRLANGMAFQVSGYYGYQSRSDVLLFARSLEGTDRILYKLYIDRKDRMYSAYRIR